MSDIEKLEFDHESHTYRFDGDIVPGVTSVLEDVGLSDFSMVPPDVLAQAQAFGTEVHNITEQFDKDEPIDAKYSESAGLYLCHYIKFLNDFDVEILEVEKKLFCKKYKYAGTLDRIAILKKISDKPCLFDIKTGGKAKSHQIQTAAYEYANKQDKRSNMDRYTLYLEDDGYNLSEVYKSRQDFDVFLGALSVYNFKRGSK